MLYLLYNIYSMYTHTYIYTHKETHTREHIYCIPTSQRLAYSLHFSITATKVA